MRYNASLLLCIIALSGCVRTKKVGSHVSVTHTEDSCDIATVYKEQSFKETALSAIRRCVSTEAMITHDAVQQIEARCIDIPIPLGASPVESHFERTDDGDFCVAYTMLMPVAELNSFFCREMERSGWQKVASYEQYEQLLLYEKPHKMVIISLRPSDKKGKQHLFVITQLHIE